MKRVGMAVVLFREDGYSEDFAAQGGCACCAVRGAMVRRALDEMVRY